MADRDETPIELEDLGNGVFAAPGARIIDKSGNKALAVGFGDYVSAARVGTLVDKSMLIADVLSSGRSATLFCRPRRFGKSLNMTMAKAFLEAPDAGGLPTEEAQALFSGTEVMETEGGRWKSHLGAYPVVHLSLSKANETSWERCRKVIEDLVAKEYLRHGYLRECGGLLPEEEAYFDRIASKEPSYSDAGSSLATLCHMLSSYHGHPVVLLIDEYDAPVMAGYTNGYYNEVVNFMRGWLIGAVKEGGRDVAFSCLTGVQRISKESIFSGLNNISVSTPLDDAYDERYGFTDAEVAALATYLGHPECMQEAHDWYDGYRFGNVDVYNPWSVISYLDAGCRPGIYWGNTSSNEVLGELVSGADSETLGDVYALLEPGGEIWAPLDLNVVFPELGMREGALWSMLYLSGYVTTDDVEDPTDVTRLRPLRVPDREIARIYRAEVIERFRASAGGPRRLMALQSALVSGDEAAFGTELSRIARDSASFHDLVDEASCHMLLMGLAFGTPGYLDPVSNREAGYGRNDFCLAPDPLARGRWATGPRPLVTVEVKFLGKKERPEETDELMETLAALAQEGLAQIAEGEYDAQLPPAAQGRVRWGVAFAGKRVAVACERA